MRLWAFARGEQPEPAYYGKLPLESFFTAAFALTGHHMPFKALRLKRTNIFYPSSGATPDLKALLKSLTLTQDALDDILDIEDSAFANSVGGAECGGLEQLVTAARKLSLLSTPVLRKIYFHILRQGAIPKKCGKSDLGTLLLAYQDLMGELHRGYPAIRFPKLEGLLIFGHSGQLNLDQGQPPSYDEFKHRMAVLGQCGKYIHIPGMLERMENFLPFANDDKTAQRVLTLLRVLDYQPSDFASTYPTDIFWIDKKFWGLVAIVLLNKTLRQDLLRDLVMARTTLPQFDEHVQMLGRFVDAIADSDLSRQFLEFKAALT